MCNGAPWIVDKFRDNFGSQGSYLLDFYHVSQYLAQAATKVVHLDKQREWTRRQQGRCSTTRPPRFCAACNLTSNRQTVSRLLSALRTDTLANATIAWIMQQPGPHNCQSVQVKLRVVTVT